MEQVTTTGSVKYFGTRVHKSTPVSFYTDVDGVDG